MLMYIFCLGNWFCLAARKRENFGLHLSDLYIRVIPKALHSLLGLSEVCVMFEGMTEVISGYLKAREKQKYCSFQGMQDTRNTAKGA